MTPPSCCKCGRFIGKDGYPDITYDWYIGGWEEGYSYCGPCGRAMGYKDLRKVNQNENHNQIQANQSK